MRAGVFGFGFGCEPEGIAEPACFVEGMELASAFAAGLVLKRDDVQVLMRTVDGAPPGAFEFEAERVECAGGVGLGLVQLNRCRLNSLTECVGRFCARGREVCNPLLVVQGAERLPPTEQLFDGSD